MAEQFQDQTRYCDRCGISFLWSAEEQRADRAAGRPAPIYCAGCRALLPAPGRERGLVKWYNVRRRYGFIVRKDQPEIFVHGSDLAGEGRLRPGDLVEFVVGEGERGPAAKEIQVLEHFELPVA